MNGKTDTSQLVVSQYSPTSFLIGAILSAIFAYSTSAAYGKLSGVSSQVLAIGALVCFLCISGSIFMFIIWWFKRRSDEMCHSKSPIRIKVLHVLENSYIILLILSLSIRVVLQTVIGQCSGQTLLMETAQFCNTFQDEKLIQPAHLTTIMFFPIVSFFLIRETKPTCIAISWLISMFTLIWCTVSLRSVYLIPPTVIYFCISLLVFYVTKQQNDDILQLVRALQITVAENERLQEEVHATELRAMIGNVAHDLKTVSYYLLNSCVSTMLLLCVWSLD